MDTSDDARPCIGAQRIDCASIRYGGPRGGETMPFRNHRTVAEVWADEVRCSIRRSLGK